MYEKYVPEYRVTQKEIEKLRFQPENFAQNMDSSDLERIVGYFVDELRRRHGQKRLEDF